jgi:DNA-binding IclR family transcriptional regulator
MKGPAVYQINDKSDPDDVARAREDRHFVTALGRGLEVPVCFRRGEAFLANQDTAERYNRPRSTVSRLTHTLSRIGYLHCVEEIGQYRRGTALISLSSTALGGLDVRTIARPAMRDLADVSKASVGLGVRERLSMCYVNCLRSSAATSLSNDVGSRISVATSAMGRAYIAVCGAEEGAAIYDGLDKEMDEYRTLGCCASLDEWQDTVNAIAVGFRPGGGLPAMAINCGGPTVITEPGFLLEHVPPHRSFATSKA